MHRGNRKLAREEQSEFTVSPTPEGTNKTRTYFLGKYARKGKMHEYHSPNYTYKDLDIDGELISDFTEDVTNDKSSRDGIGSDLFPLTSQQQNQYTFRLEETEEYKGRQVYRINFQPLKKKWQNGIPWKGEVLVDMHEFQPVLITTRLAKGVPIWARMFLGTNIKHLGFKLEYKEFDEGLWFPVSYGGEFKVRGLFFYKRNISISLLNSGFKHAQVSSAITYRQLVQ